MQFLVDRIALGFGRLQQALDLGGDFGLQMVLQHGALVRGEQFAALGDLFGQARGKAVRPFGAVLVDDVDDQVPSRSVRPALWWPSAPRARCSSVRSSPICRCTRAQASSSSSEVGQRLFGAAGQSERRIDRPWAAHVGQIGLRQRGRQQAGGREVLELRDRFGARLAALLRERQVRGRRPVHPRRRALRRLCAETRRAEPQRHCRAPSTAARASANCRCSSSTLAPTASRSTSSRAAASSASIRAVAELVLPFVQIIARLRSRGCAAAADSGSARRSS